MLKVESKGTYRVLSDAQSLAVLTSILTDFNKEPTPDNLRRAIAGPAVYKEALTDNAGVFSIYSLALAIEQLESSTNGIISDDGSLSIKIGDVKDFCSKYLYRADLYLKENARGRRLGERLFQSTLQNYKEHHGHLHTKNTYFLGWTDNYRVLKMSKQLGGYELDPHCYRHWSETDIKNMRLEIDHFILKTVSFGDDNNVSGRLFCNDK
jgi:hypothetical protein